MNELGQTRTDITRGEADDITVTLGNDTYFTANGIQKTEYDAESYGATFECHMMQESVVTKPAYEIKIQCSSTSYFIKYQITIIQ